MQAAHETCFFVCILHAPKQFVSYLLSHEENNGLRKKIDKVHILQKTFSFVAFNSHVAWMTDMTFFLHYCNAGGYIVCDEAAGMLSGNWCLDTLSVCDINCDDPPTQKSKKVVCDGY